MKKLLILLFLLCVGFAKAQNEPELIIQVGHSKNINAIAFTPDSRYIVTAGEDRVLKMWHVATGLEMRTFTGHQGAVTGVCFSPDGKQMISSGMDKKIIIWNPKTGEIIKKLIEHDEPVHCVDYSPDGKYLISGSEESSALLWDTSNWKVIEKIGKYRKPIMTAKFSPNSDKIVLSTFRAGNKILDFGRNGVFSIPEGKQMADFPSKAASMEFSPDGEYLLSGVGPASGMGLAKVDELPTKYKVMDFKGGYSYVKRSAVITNYDPDNFEQYYKENIAKGYYAPMGFGFSSFIDSETVVAGNAIGEVMVFKLEDMPRMYAFADDADNMFDAIKEGYKSGFAQAKAVKQEDWDRMKEEVERLTPLAKPIKYIKAHYNTADLLHLVLSPNKQYVFTAAKDGTMKITDLEAKRVFKTFESKVTPMDFASISTDSKYAILGKGWNERFIIDLRSGEYIYSFETKKRGTIAYFSLSEDQRYALLATERSGYVRLWDLEKNKVVWETLGHSDAINYVAFSEDLSYGISRSNSGEEKHWDLTTGEPINTLQSEAKVVEKPDIRVRGNKAVISYDSGEEVTIEHQNKINDANISTDGRFIVSASDDGTFRIWNAKTGEELVAFMITKDYGSLMLTPDKYYYATRDGLGSVAFRYQERMFPFQQFDLHYNRPDIVLGRLGLADKRLIDAYEAAHKKRVKRAGIIDSSPAVDLNAPKLELLSTDIPLSTDQRNVGIKFKASDSKYALKRFEVIVNDVPIYGREGLAVSGKEVTKDIAVELAKGNNEILIRAVNEKGVSSVPEVFNIVLQAPNVQPNIYLIAIGVSKYKEAAQSLEYAAKDAQDLAGILKNHSQYGEVFHKELLNERATKENILGLESFLAKATVDDLVVVFLAGHGMLDSNFDYIFGTYDIDFKSPNARGLGYAEFEELLESTKARRKVLLMDTCHSGEVDKDDIEKRKRKKTLAGKVKFRAVGEGVAYKEGLGLENVNRLVNSMFSDVRTGTGATIIAAAGGVEVAAEGLGQENGLFTHCLLTGIKEQHADADNDDAIMLSELKKYVRQQVMRLSKGLQMPTSRSENIHDFRFW